MSECLCGKKFPAEAPHVVEINQEAKVPFIYKVEIPAEAGDDTVIVPATGAYRNTIVEYLANDHVYFYSSDGAYTLITTARIEDYVLSVNGRTGAVRLTAADVNALPADTKIPSKTSDLNNDSDFIDGNGLAAGLDALRQESDSKFVDQTELTEKFKEVPTKTSQLTNDSGFITGTALADEARARSEADTAIRNDMVKIVMTKEDPGEGAPLAPNTILGVYR